MPRLPLTSNWRRLALGLAALALVVAAAVVLLVGSGSNRSVRGQPRTAPGSAQQPEALAAPREQRFGASVNLLFNGRLSSAAQIENQLAALRATGATIARSDAFWEATEPSPPSGGVHRYDWRFDDVVAGALAMHGLTWLPIIDYSAPWAQSIPGRDHSPPRPGAGVVGYAAYAAALVARYGRGGTFWHVHPELPARPVDTVEIWNEPDSPAFWKPAPDAGAYARLYSRARAAVFRVSRVTRVIIGGLTEPWSFLPAMLAADPGLHGKIDGVAVHPYARPASAVLGAVTQSRATLQKLGLGAVPLYITEFGWTTRPPGARFFAPPALRPVLIAEIMQALSTGRCGIADLVLYTWVSPRRNPRDREQWYGINPPQGGSSADVAAFARAIATAEGRRPAAGGGGNASGGAQRTHTVARAPLLVQPSSRSAACR